jgi:excisionase family DNA binding protein
MNRYESQLLTVEEVATFLHLSRKTVREYVRERGLPCVRFGNRLRFRPDALRAWLERAEGGPMK